MRDKEWVASAAGEVELREDAEDAFDDDRFLEEYRWAGKGAGALRWGSGMSRKRW